MHRVPINYERTTRKKRYLCIGGELRIEGNRTAPVALALPVRVRKTEEERAAERAQKVQRNNLRRAEEQRAQAEQEERRLAEIDRIVNERMGPVIRKHHRETMNLQERNQQAERELQQLRDRFAAIELQQLRHGAQSSLDQLVSAIRNRNRTGKA